MVKDCYGREAGSPKKRTLAKQQPVMFSNLGCHIIQFYAMNKHSLLYSMQLVLVGVGQHVGSLSLIGL